MIKRAACGAAGTSRHHIDRALMRARVKDVFLICARVVLTPAAGVEQIRTQLDRLRQKAGTSVVLVGWADEGKVGFMSAVTDDLTAKVQAGKLVGEIAKVCGGKGGGRPDMAQAGGSDPAKLSEALALGAKLIGEKLEG